MIHTSACDVLGIDHPVVQAGMGGGTDPRLVSTVSEAGGLGVLACSWTTPEDIRAQIADIRARTGRPFGANFVIGQAPADHVDIAIAERVPVISLFRGTDPSAIVAKAHAAGLVVMHQVTTLEEARLSLAAGIDVVIVQGREGGGHMGPEPMWTLLPQVIAIAGDTPVLASGGLVDGHDLAAVLAIGAAGVHMGTRFLASVEAPITDEFKRRIVAAGAGATVASKMWDILWGRHWPGVQVRSLRNDFTDRWAGRENELVAYVDDARAQLDAARAASDHSKINMLAGEGVARISAILPAAEIVRSVVAEAETVIRGLGGLVR